MNNTLFLLGQFLLGGPLSAEPFQREAKVQCQYLQLIRDSQQKWCLTFHVKAITALNKFAAKSSTHNLVAIAPGLALPFLDCITELFNTCILTVIFALFAPTFFLTSVLQQDRNAYYQAGECIEMVLSSLPTLIGMVAMSPFMVTSQLFSVICDPSNFKPLK